MQAEPHAGPAEKAVRAEEAVREDETLVEIIPVLEEIARIEKREVETGRVRLHKSVRERDETVEVLLRQEDIEVERVPVGRVVSEAPAPWQDGDTYVVPILEEVLVVEKRLVVKEELRVRRKATERTQREVVRLRTEEVQVETVPPAPPAGPVANP